MSQEFGRFREINEPAIKVFSQEEGLSVLWDFLQRGQPFETLSPIALDITDLPEMRPGYVYPARNYRSNRNRVFTLSIPYEVINQNHSYVWAVPQKHEVGEKPYYWLDFYSPSEKQKFESIRLLPGEKKYTDSMNWRSIEEALFVDYVLGKNNIQFEDLLPFSFSLNSTYRISRVDNFNLGIQANPSCKKNDTISVYPARDIRGNYEWAEMYNVTQGNIPVPLTYKIDRENKRITRRNWSGAPRQLALEYITQKRPVMFEDLLPIPFTANKSSEVWLGKDEIKPHNIYYGKGVLDEGDAGIFLPERKAKKEYFVLYRYNPKTGKIDEVPLFEKQLSVQYEPIQEDHSNNAIEYRNEFRIVNPPPIDAYNNMLSSIGVTRFERWIEGELSEIFPNKKITFYKDASGEYINETEIYRMVSINRKSARYPEMKQQLKELRSKAVLGRNGIFVNVYSLSEVLNLRLMQQRLQYLKEKNIILSRDEANNLINEL